MYIFCQVPPPSKKVFEPNIEGTVNVLKASLVKYTWPDRLPSVEKYVFSALQNAQEAKTGLAGN